LIRRISGSLVIALCASVYFVDTREVRVSDNPECYTVKPDLGLSVVSLSHCDLLLLD